MRLAALAIPLALAACTTTERQGSAPAAAGAPVAAPAPAPAPAPASASATESAAAAPATTEPMMMPETLTRPFVPSTGTGTMPEPYHPGGRQFLVQPGQVWQHLVAEIRPGDEVVLPPGFHAPQVVVGLRGEPMRPIYIRSRDRVQAAVAAARDGFVLRDAEHVIVENVLFLNPTNAAITLDSSTPGVPRLASVEVRQCTIRGTKGGPGQDGVRAKDCIGVRITGVHVEDWNDAAVDIDSCAGVRISRLMTSGEGKAPRSRGIAIRGASSDVLISESAINGDARVAVEVGSASGESTAAATVPPSNVRMKGLILNAPGTGIRIRAGEGVLLGRTTIHEPRDAVYEITGEGPVSRVVVEQCLCAWTPGGLARFSPHGAGVDAAGVTLKENLWYSPELPEAWDLIGRPFGTERAPQRTDIDPRVDPKTLRAANPAANGFGAFDPSEAPPPAPVPRPRPAK